MRWLPALLLASAAAAQELANPSFDEGLAGWTLEIGATHGAAAPASAVEPDGNRRSLRVSGDDATMVWRMAVQTVPCKAGHRVVLRVAARGAGLHKTPRQYRNANGLLLFRDAAGARLGLVTTPALEGDREWVDLFAHVLAPEGTATVTVGVFSSMTGTAWFDDVRLEIAPPDDCAAALRALRLHLERTYPFWDLEGKPKPEDLPFRPEEGMAPALMAMLAPLRDIHVWIDGPWGRIPTVRGNPHSPNWSDAVVRARLTETLHEKGGHLVGRIGDVAYVRIGNFTGGFDALEDAMDRLGDARAWVLDVRPNGGGDERFAWRIARRFVAEEVEYGFAQVRDPTLPGLAGYGPRAARTMAPPPGQADRRPVAVLQGPYCVSSTETFLLLMGRLGSVTTVGLPTRGSSGNPRPFRVAPGIDVWVPTHRYFTAEGEAVEGKGVAPDVSVEEAHGEADPTLAKALELLAR